MVACGSASRKYDDVLNCIDQLLDKEAQVNAYNRYSNFTKFGFVQSLESQI